jgi:hypothetical protein
VLCFVGGGSSAPFLKYGTQECASDASAVLADDPTPLDALPVGWSSFSTAMTYPRRLLFINLAGRKLFSEV